MDPRQTLSTFFQSTEPSTLDNCDREQIHLSGAIQNIGALLVVDPVTQRVTGFSENAAQLLGIETDQLSKASLDDIDTDLAAQVKLSVNGSHILHEVLDYQLEHAGVFHDTVTHAHAGRRLIEFIPNASPSATSSRKKMRECSKACTTILHSENFDKALQIAVDAIRQITGFARIKVYRFQADWSGKTIAESNDGSLPSYLGLHFPERDIPRQVRHMMTIVPYRGIGSTSNDTLRVHAIGHGEHEREPELDLTWSVLRSVSPMHTQYLANMGIASTFSTSLMHKGTLWGLIACHNTAPGMIPFDSWGFLHEIGTALMIRHEQQRQTDIADMSHRLRLIESRFSSALQQNGRAEEIIKLLSPSLQQFLEADGFAFLYGSRMYLSGTTPPEEFIRELVDWADNSQENANQYHTSALHKQWPDALAHQDCACGVLVQSTTLHHICQIVWFRKPVTQSVPWAGRPHDKSADATTLTPRVSFEQWVQEHAEQSIEWRETELEMAREILRDFLDIITSQLLLNQENEFLRHFAASAAHDLKTPLRGINAALDIMDDEDFDEAVVKQTHAIARKSARRLSDLTTGLMELSMTTDQKHEFETTNLATTINDVLEMLSLPIEETAAVITVGEMPVMQANDTLMLRLFLNLISNAIKYRHPDRTPDIRITADQSVGKVVTLSVTDNGLGIDPKFAEKVFQPLERLHSSDAIEGSGLGLTICQRAAEAHSGTIRLDTDHLDGCRFIVTIPFKA